MQIILLIMSHGSMKKKRLHLLKKGMKGNIINILQEFSSSLQPG